MKAELIGAVYFKTESNLKCNLTTHTHFAGKPNCFNCNVENGFCSFTLCTFSTESDNNLQLVRN